MRSQRGGKRQKRSAVIITATKGETALKGSNMTDEQFERFMAVFENIASEIEDISLNIDCMTAHLEKLVQEED
jgi:hypothetical protein